MPCYVGEVESDHPKFPPGSSAGCGKASVAHLGIYTERNHHEASETGTKHLTLEDLCYSKADDEAIEQFVRDKVQVRVILKRVYLLIQFVSMMSLMTMCLIS